MPLHLCEHLFVRLDEPKMCKRMLRSTINVTIKVLISDLPHGLPTKSLLSTLVYQLTSRYLRVRLLNIGKKLFN